jgi:hypothetical protein
MSFGASGRQPGSGEVSRIACEGKAQALDLTHGEGENGSRRQAHENCARRHLDEHESVLGNRPLTEEERAQIESRIAALEVEHRDLDDVIARLVGDPLQDQLQLRRLKKRKLLLKDSIARLRDRIIPDIIA